MAVSSREAPASGGRAGFAVANRRPSWRSLGSCYLWTLRASLAVGGAWSYALLAYVGYVSALAYLPCLLVLVPVILLRPCPTTTTPPALPPPPRLDGHSGS
jgi:hypothetical protein